jgi:hypothetical protein
MVVEFKAASGELKPFDAGVTGAERDFGAPGKRHLD